MNKSSKHLNRFFSRKSWKDIIRYMPNRLNLKEITEVMAVWNAARRYVNDVDGVVDCGSGKYSSLGVLAAFSCKKRVYSIDPRNDIVQHKEIDRYKIYNKKLKDVIFYEPGILMLLSCHGHQSLAETREFLARHQKWVYITMPCCIDNRLPNRWAKTYIDKHVWSDKNTIYIYENLA